MIDHPRHPLIARGFVGCVQTFEGVDHDAKRDVDGNRIIGARLAEELTQ